MNNPFLPFILDAVQSLFLFGGAGLVALGCYLNRKMGIDLSFYPVLWLAGSVYVYNLDRLIPDPADAINLPNRLRFRRIRVSLIVLCLAALIGTTALFREWILLALVIIAAVISSLYSLRPMGFSSRLKDILFLKWLVPPTVIMVSLTAPAWTQPEKIRSLLLYWPLIAGIFLALLTNILLFDQRDRFGDIAAGLNTLATELRPTQFNVLLWSMVGLQLILAIADPQPELFIFVAYLTFLVWVSRKPRPVGFYHWAVDGMLFVPLLGRLFWK